MSMEPFCQEGLSIGPVVPWIVALALENCTVPKSAKGRTPKRDEGASSIHSAEDRLALLSDLVIEYDWLVEVSVMDKVNLPEA